jgi:hypothetical protein
MTRGPLARGISVALLVALVLVPATAMAHGRGGGKGGHGGHGGRPSSIHHGGRHHHFASKGQGAHHHHHFGSRFRHGRSAGAFATPAVYASPYWYSAPSVPYYEPPSYDPPGYYYAPPVSYAPPAGAISVAPSPPPPPMPTVVEHPTGRYELRGDGMTTPYAWVWIPNPPSAPPPEPPSVSEPAPRAPRAQLYRWLDDNGVAHWTDRLDAVPPQHRAQAPLPR